MSKWSLEGKVALLTGASSGMGFATARALAQRGAKVVIASRGGAKLERAHNELAAEGAQVEAVVVDVRSAESLKRLVQQTEGTVGPVDVLVANGGGPPSKRAVDLEEQDWQEALNLCLLFVPRLCSLVLPGMRKRGWGRIVALNSVSARQPIPNLALSNTLRPAVVGYLKTLSQEVARDGITVNSVLPGYTRTDRQEELAAGGLAAHRPQGRGGPRRVGGGGAGRAPRRAARDRRGGRLPLLAGGVVLDRAGDHRRRRLRQVTHVAAAGGCR